MSEGRGLTLRKKRKDRPAVSGPKQSTVAVPKAQPATAPQTQKSINFAGTLVLPPQRAAGSETSDLVKRRYSTRYAQLPDFSKLGVPPVPGLPGGMRRGSRAYSPRRPTFAVIPETSGPLQVDETALADPHLQAERYVANMLSNASEAEIQDYQNALKQMKLNAATDLQQSVLQNRAQFIRISQEAEKLTGEMTILQALMSELTTALGQQNTNGAGAGGDDGAANIRTRRGAMIDRRSSVANLENMWNIQLQALWKYIEKSQKFLPAVPGRHIVMETGSWIELDSATWKPKRPVHIVILNDHLLVASKKRKRLDPNVPQKGPAPTKLVAEECWPLQEVEVVDLSAQATKTGSLSPAEERAMATALSFRSVSRSLTYRHEKRDDRAKAELMTTFRKTVDDLRKANKSDTGKTNAHTDTLNYFASRDAASTGNDDIIDSIMSNKAKPDFVVEVDGKQENFRWVEGQIDELDIDIALQRSQDAVERVERLRTITSEIKDQSVARELAMVQIEERATELAALLCRDLAETPSFMEATKKITGYLIRLGFEDRAREVYLNARTEALTKRVRQCIFEGNLHQYIFAMSYVYFVSIKNTVSIYQASFAQGSISACVKWANDHLETFNAILRRQLSSVEKEGQVWRECMDLVWAHEKELLGAQGLDFREVIGRGIEIGELPLSRQVSATTPGGGGEIGYDPNRGGPRQEVVA